MNLAPGWQIRCPKCGRVGALGQTGAIRLGAASIFKRKLAWCRDCRWIRWCVVERQDPPQVRSDAA